MKKSLFFFITVFTALGFIGYNSVFGMVPTVENSSDQKSRVEEDRGDPADESAALVVRKEQNDQSENDQSKIAKPKIDFGKFLVQAFAGHEEQFFYLLLYLSLLGGTSYDNNPSDSRMVRAFENSILKKNSGFKDKFIGMLNSQLSNSDSSNPLINVVVNNKGSRSDGKSKKWRSRLWRGTKEFVGNTVSCFLGQVEGIGGYTIKHIVPTVLATIFIVGLGVTLWNNMPFFGDKLPINAQNIKKGIDTTYSILDTGKTTIWDLYKSYKGIPVS